MAAGGGGLLSVVSLARSTTLSTRESRSQESGCRYYAVHRAYSTSSTDHRGGGSSLPGIPN
jgi:hypothetical protein